MKILSTAIFLLWISISLPIVRFVVEGNNIYTIGATLYGPGQVALLLSSFLITIFGILEIYSQNKKGRALKSIFLGILKDIRRSLKLIFEIILTTYIASVLFIFDFGSYLWNILAAYNGLLLFIFLRRLWFEDL